jgi:hypothetical protein
MTASENASRCRCRAERHASLGLANDRRSRSAQWHHATGDCLPLSQALQIRRSDPQHSPANNPTFLITGRLNGALAAAGITGLRAGNWMFVLTARASKCTRHFTLKRRPVDTDVRAACRLDAEIRAAWQEAGNAEYLSIIDWIGGRLENLEAIEES